MRLWVSEDGAHVLHIDGEPPAGDGIRWAERPASEAEEAFAAVAEHAAATRARLAAEHAAEQDAAMRDLLGDLGLEPGSKGAAALAKLIGLGGAS